MLNWLTGYPKSGNTWLSHIIASLIHGPVHNHREAAQYVPYEGALADKLLDVLGSPRPFAKSHHCFAQGALTADNIRKVVTVMRNPFDVAVSSLDYVLLTTPNIGQESASDVESFKQLYLDVYCLNGGDPKWQEYGFGTQVENVESWTQESLTFPVLAMRYEDLKKDFLGETKKLADFLEIDVNIDQISAIEQATSFNRMKKNEEEDAKAGVTAFTQHPENIDTGMRFVNKGEIGRGMRQLSAEQKHNLTRKTHPLLQRWYPELLNT